MRDSQEGRGMRETYDYRSLDVDTQDGINRFVGLGYLIGDTLSAWANGNEPSPMAMEELALTVLDRTRELDRLLHRRD